MTSQQHARQLRKWGFVVVPLRPGTKEPSGGPGWQQRALSGRARVGPRDNLGIYCGVRIRDGHKLIVIDVDVKKNKNGDLSLKRLQADHGSLPLTVRATTPTGGEHIYLAVPDAIDITDIYGRLGNLGYGGIDLLGHGRLVVVPPSTIGTKGYDWTYRPDEKDVTIAPAPAWLLELLRPSERSLVPATRPGTPRPAGGDHLGDIIRRFPVTANASRNPQMSRAVLSLAYRGLDDDAIKELIGEWHRHFAGSYRSSERVIAGELTSCLACLRRKEARGQLKLGLPTHAQRQSVQTLSDAENAFLVSLSSMVRKGQGQPEASQGGFDLDEEAEERERKRTSLTPGEQQFAEALVLVLAYRRGRKELIAADGGSEVLLTNQQLMDVMAARFGVEFPSAANEIGSKKFRRLKAAFVTKRWRDKLYEAEKVELLELLVEGRLGVASRYRLRGPLADLFREPGA